MIIELILEFLTKNKYISAISVLYCIYEIFCAIIVFFKKYLCPDLRIVLIYSEKEIVWPWGYRSLDSDKLVVEVRITNTKNKTFERQDIAPTVPLQINSTHNCIINASIISSGTKGGNFQITESKSDHIKVDFDYLKPKETAIIEIEIASFEHLRVSYELKFGRFIRIREYRIVEVSYTPKIRKTLIRDNFINNIFKILPPIIIIEIFVFSLISYCVSGVIFTILAARIILLSEILFLIFDYVICVFTLTKTKKKIKIN